MLNLYINLQINLTNISEEEAKVKEYHRKNKEGVKKPYYQINLSKKSKFSEVKPIALIDVAEIEKISQFMEANPIEEKEAKINELEEEVDSLKKQLQELKASNEKLTSKNDGLKEDLILTKTKLEYKSEELSKEKDLTKSLLVVRSDFLKQGRLKRFLKVEPKSSKIIGNIKELPEVVETETKPSKNIEH